MSSTSSMFDRRAWNRGSRLSNAEFVFSKASWRARRRSSRWLSTSVVNRAMISVNCWYSRISRSMNKLARLSHRRARIWQTFQVVGTGSIAESQSLVSIAYPCDPSRIRLSQSVETHVNFGCRHVKLGLSRDGKPCESVLLKPDAGRWNLEASTLKVADGQTCGIRVYKVSRGLAAIRVHGSFISTIK